MVKSQGLLTLNPATQAAIKNRAMYLINRFRAIEISLEKSKGAAIITAEELHAAWDKNYKNDYTPDSEMEWEKINLMHEELVNAIRAF